MGDLKVFNHDVFGELPVIVIDEGEWFGATEAAKALSFTDPHKAVSNHVEEEDWTVHPVGVVTGKKVDGSDAIQKVKKKFINESGLYSLIFGAARQGNNPEIREKAKKFKRWVTSEVLPSIRKHGAYMTDNVLERVLKDPDFLIELALQLKEEQKARKELELKNAQKDQMISELQPKATYYDVVLQSKDALSITKIAKDYGLSGTRLNSILHELGVQYKQGGCWLLYQKYANKGYTKSKTHSLTDGRTVLHTYWTQKGRLFIYDLLKNEKGLLPIIELDGGKSV